MVYRLCHIKQTRMVILTVLTMACYVQSIVFADKTDASIRKVAHSRPKPVLVDTNASPETQALFNNLRRQMGRGILFGHHHSTLHGLGWHHVNGPTAPLGSSDVKKLTGSYPAVYGWDFIECRSPKLNTEKQKKAEAVMKKLIIKAFEAGGVNTVSWHMHNPVTGGSYNHFKENTVTRILPGGDRHHALKKELDWAADFFHGLKTDTGVSVPVIFRPFHEHTHDGFWWNIPNASLDDFIRLWRFTVTYLRDTRQVHNLLWAISPSGRVLKATPEAYLTVYPGDDFVDILGFDHYLGQSKDPDEADTKTRNILGKVKIVVNLARQKNKVAAWTETGHGQGLADCQLPDWYDAHFWKLLKQDDPANRIAYLMVWRNISQKKFWVPQPNDNQAAGFLNMFRDDYCIFGNTMPDMYQLRP